MVASGSMRLQYFSNKKGLCQRERQHIIFLIRFLVLQLFLAIFFASFTKITVLLCFFVFYDETGSFLFAL